MRRYTTEEKARALLPYLDGSKTLSDLELTYGRRLYIWRKDPKICRALAEIFNSSPEYAGSKLFPEDVKSMLRERGQSNKLKGRALFNPRTI